MNNLVLDTKHQTPIEILLQVDGEGRTTARKLYEFLELDKSNYSRWCKTNIVNNAFAEENVDFWAFVINDEWGGQATTDYKLTASFAKKLALGCNNKKGEIAKDYFLKVEDILRNKVKSHNELEMAKVEAQKARAEAMLLNAKNRTYKTLMNSIRDKHLSPIAVQVFGLKGMEGIFGVDVGNCLPETERTYSATEIGEMLGGISAQRIGSIAKENNLKTSEYGVWVMDKSRYSSKEVSCFRYNKKAIEKFKELIGCR